MNEINKAKRLRMAAVDEGEGVKIRAIKEAEAEVRKTTIRQARTRANSSRPQKRPVGE
jgi:hypothetical protein